MINISSDIPLSPLPGHPKLFTSPTTNVKCSIIAILASLVVKPIQYFILQRNNDWIKRQNIQKIIHDLKSQSIKRARGYAIVLPIKDYFNEDLQQAGLLSIFAVPFLTSLTLNYFLYNFDRHKIEIVNMLIKEQQMRKKLKQNNKGYLSWFWNVQNHRSVGITSFCIGLGLQTAISIAPYDFADQQWHISDNILFGIFIGTLNNIVANRISIPFVALSHAKYMSKKYNFEHNQFYQSESYWNLVQKIRSKNLIFFKFGAASMVLPLKNGIILTTYAKLKSQYLQRDNYNLF